MEKSKRERERERERERDGKPNGTKEVTWGKFWRGRRSDSKLTICGKMTVSMSTCIALRSVAALFRSALIPGFVWRDIN